MARADQLIEIFDEAKALVHGAERDAFLEKACKDQPELMEQVLTLLQAHEAAGEFLALVQAQSLPAEFFRVAASIDATIHSHFAKRATARTSR